MKKNKLYKIKKNYFKDKNVYKILILIQIINVIMISLNQKLIQKLEQKSKKYKNNKNFIVVLRFLILYIFFPLKKISN